MASRMRSAWFACFLALLSPGCVRTAIVKFWEPAAIDTCGMNRIVVMDFTGDQGESVARSLSAELWENKFYAVVDPAELADQVQMAAFTKGNKGNLSGILGPAHEHGIDGVLLGEVLEYRCDDRHYRKKTFNFTNDVRPGITPLGGQAGGLEIRETYVREGTVTIAFRLVDAATGELRAARQVSKSYTGHIENGTGRLPSKEEILQQLTEDCLTEIVDMLAPHESTSQITLARSDVWSRGHREVKQGLVHAEKGDWEEAEQKWQLALELNPSNHAALFNLAVAADHRQEYALAENFAMQALRLQHKTCYADGLKTIRIHRVANDQIQSQRESQVVTAGELDWQ